MTNVWIDIHQDANYHNCHWQPRHISLSTKSSFLKTWNKDDESTKFGRAHRWCKVWVSQSNQCVFHQLKYTFCQVAFPFFASLTCALAHVNLLTAWHETRRDLTKGYQRQLAACVFSMACANPGLKILCWVIVGQTQHFSLDMLEELECEIVLAVVKWRPTDIYVNAWWPAMRQVELHKCAVESTEAPNPFRLSEICSLLAAWKQDQHWGFGQHNLQDLHHWYSEKPCVANGCQWQVSRYTTAELASGSSIMKDYNLYRLYIKH